MSEPSKDQPIVMLTRSELHEIIVAAVKEAVTHPGDDKLLDITQAAAVLNCKTDWLYHNVKSLPFIKKVGGQLRFSNKGIQKYIESKNGGPKGH